MIVKKAGVGDAFGKRGKYLWIEDADGHIHILAKFEDPEAAEIFMDCAKGGLFSESGIVDKRGTIVG